jgi:HSP20 family molecular chaperone IbpA
MVRRFHRSIYDELDELRASMDYLYQLALDPVDNPLLPGGENPDTKCQYAHNLNAEVAEYGDEVMVTVDMIPGIGNAKISVGLINETTLKITCEREEKCSRDIDGKHLHKQRSFSLHHVIPLPGPVMKPGAKISRKNGVLDIHLRKAPGPSAKK